MKLDGHTICDRCEASAHDVIDERRGEVLLECCFCGFLKWCKAPQRRAFAPADTSDQCPWSTEFRQAVEPVDTTEFRFRSGRFVGMTIPEAEAQPNGRQYVEWMKANARIA